MTDSPSYNDMLQWAEHYPPGIYDVLSLSTYNAGHRSLALKAVAEKKRCSFFLPHLLGALHHDHPMTQEAGVYAVQSLIEELIGELRSISDNHLLNKGVTDAADEALELIAEALSGE